MQKIWTLLVFFTGFTLTARPVDCAAAYLDISIDGKPLLTEHDVASAQTNENLKTHLSTVSIKLEEASARAFTKATKNNIGKTLRVTLKGMKTESSLIKAAIENTHFTLPHKLSTRTAKSIVEALNQLTKEDGVLSSDDQEAFEYFGGAMGHTFRIVKLPTKDFDSLGEVLDSRELKIPSTQRFIYNSEVYCTFEQKPVFAVTHKADFTRKGNFHPVQAWSFNSETKKIQFLEPRKVDCHSS